MFSQSWRRPSVGPFVCLSIYNTVHWGSQGRCRRLKVAAVKSCTAIVFLASNFLFTPSETFAVWCVVQPQNTSHFPSPFYGPAHACRSVKRAINNIYRSLGVPATGIRLRHEYAKHAFYDTWTQVYRRLFYNPPSFGAPPQGTLANIPNVPYISRN